jgi:hypothetical protein
VGDFKKNGGQRGIRTLETVTRLHTFQACAFDHSAICPRLTINTDMRMRVVSAAFMRFQGLLRDQREKDLDNRWPPPCGNGQIVDPAWPG